jgi:hypothetical protein
MMETFIFHQALFHFEVCFWFTQNMPSILAASLSLMASTFDCIFTSGLAFVHHKRTV